MALFKSTKEPVFQEDGLVTITQMLLRWCDKDCETFNTLCTLLWVLAHYLAKKNAMRRYMTSKDAIFMLRETEKLVQRKATKHKNGQRTVACLMAPTPELMRSEPSLDPDYGDNGIKLYVFNSAVFGFESMIQLLEIELG